jgi:tRNA nucleotidyltransferase/poly(A) polymerase
MLRVVKCEGFQIMGSEMRNAALKVVQTLQDRGFQAVFAGGCVRDERLGLSPKDYDVATNAVPAEVLAAYPNAMTVGAHFGVVLVKVGGHAIEIATFRTDGSYADGRKPDASRRDFTVNGIFYDPLSETLLDFVHGQDDIDAGILRCIGDPLERFAEDHLRLLRAIRFATRFGFEIAPETWDALKTCAPSITRISPERIRDELDRIWVHPNRVLGFDLLVDSGLMPAILPEILDLQGCEQPPQWHPEGDVFVHTRMMLDILPDEASLPLVLSVLFHDIAKPATYTYDEADQRIRFNGHDKLGAEMTEVILRRLKYSNEIIEATVIAVANHMAFAHVQKMRVAKLKRFMARPTFADELELHRVDCSSSHGKLNNHTFLNAKAEEFANEPLIPSPLVNGHELMALGHEADPHLGRILHAIQTHQLEGTLRTKEEALAWLKAEGEAAWEGEG